MTGKKKINEYDYLHIAARVRVLEGRMLTRDRVERMLDARTAGEAAKVLSECGYPELSALTPAAIERLLSEARAALYADLTRFIPDPGLVDVFRVKYDYHNAKVLLKAEALGLDPGGLFLDAGRYPPAVLREDLAKDDLRHESAVFQAAVREAREVLASTGDPQDADLLLDAAYYREMLEAAKASGSAFLLDYVRLSIDSANLRAAVRAARMGRDAAFLKRVLAPGGDLPAEALAEAAAGGGDLAARCAHSPLAEAAAEGARALSGGSLTQFERLCDNAVNARLAKAGRTPFGEAPVLAYLHAREAELTTIRVILTGKLAGLDAEVIRERLRDTYA